MKKEMVSFLVTIETSAAHIERIHSLIGVLCEIARDEYRCPRFDVFQDVYAKEKFFLLETWQSQKNWDNYINSAEFHSAMEEINKLLEHPIQVIILNQLSQV